MIWKYIKILFAYDYLLKIKPLWLSHFMILEFYLCEFYIIYLSLAENYLPNFSSKFILNNIIVMTCIGFVNLLSLIFQFIVETFFKIELKTQSKFLLHNKFYNLLWSFGIYCSLIITILTFKHTMNLVYDGILSFFEY